jgi:hypothetical protein
MPVRGLALDAKRCLREVILGCLPSGGMTTDGPCQKRIEDGLLVFASGTLSATQAGWVQCTEEDRCRMDDPQNKPNCD